MTIAAPPQGSPLAERARELALEGFDAPGPDVRSALRSHPVWARLRELGTALWLDTGDEEEIGGLWTRDMTALTTNNTLLNKEVQKGLYDELVPRAARALRDAERGLDEATLVRELAFLLNATHGLRLVAAFDADVSVELHTDLARDVEATVAYARRFHAISPDRFVVKIPLTPEGLLAARRVRAEDIPVNFTLGFSARQNLLVGRIAQPSFVNVFMGRCNAFVADSGLGDGENVGEKATLASQRVVRGLREGEGLDVRQIGASMRTGRQALELAGLDVFTMPTKVAREVLELDPDPRTLEDRTGADPEVTLADDVDPAAERLDVLWTVTEGLRQAVDELARQDLDALDGDGVRAFLEERGRGDLFPRLSAAEREQLRAAGKIPVRGSWAERVRAGRASWDGLLTEAALESFAKDQAELDERIRRNL